MGDIAEMMDEGVLCPGCGVAVIGEDDEPTGVPTYCSSGCTPVGYPPLKRPKQRRRKARNSPGKTGKVVR
jgi:hypothetical protein